MDMTAYTSLFDLIDTAAFRMAGSLVPYSIKLTGILVLILLTWEAVKAALGGGVQDFLGAVFMNLIMLSLVLPILMNWSSGPLSIPLAVTTMVGEVASILGGDTSAVTSGMNSIQSAMLNMLAVPAAYNATMPADAGTIAKVMFALRWFIDAIMSMPNVALSLVGVLLLGLMAALMIGIQVIGDIMLGVAMVLGPFFLAWSVFPLTRFLRDGLIKFVFNGVALKLVGIVLAGIVGTAAQAFTSAKMMNGGEPNTLAILALIGMIVLLLYVLFQAQTLASALVSGGSLDTPGSSLKRTVVARLAPKK